MLPRRFLGQSSSWCLTTQPTIHIPSLLRRPRARFYAKSGPVRSSCCSALLHISKEPSSKMNEQARSWRRIALGVFAIMMGCVSLVGLSSTSYYFGLGIFGGAYGAVMIALGVALIAKK